MRLRHLLLACSALLFVSTACGQDTATDNIIRALEKEKCTVLNRSRVAICRYDYTVDGRAVEALSFAPPVNTPSPGVLMIPGYERTARDLIVLAARLAVEGFACLAVTQPGFGKSEGPADFVGPKTLKVMTAGYRKFEGEPFVDPKRMGVYGYSRGAMAASLLVTELDDVKAAVFGAGVYDFRRAYDDSTLPGVRANM
jgi:dipeptidyl aminopeptidase/acylaminoacyl peptidase